MLQNLTRFLSDRLEVPHSVLRLLYFGMVAVFICSSLPLIPVKAQEIITDESQVETADVPEAVTDGENISPVEKNASLEVVDSGTCGGNMQWSLSGDGTLNITGSGEMEKWPAWPSDKITKVIISNGVTSIVEDAFRCCSSLTEIIISKGVTSIVDGTFSGCSNLERADINLIF